jgi:hypothetical protein
MTMKKAFQFAVLVGVIGLGAATASAAQIDCFSTQSNNTTISVPANGGTVDVFISGSGGVWVETAPFNLTDNFDTIIMNTSNVILDDDSGQNLYSRTYLSSGAGTVRIRNFNTSAPAFTAVITCVNAFPRHN